MDISRQLITLKYRHDVSRRAEFRSETTNVDPLITSLCEVSFILNIPTI